MVAVLFLQSGLDKLFNWKSNKDYLVEHFSKSILNGSVPLLLPVITLVELSAGLFSAAGLASVLLGKTPCLGSLGMVFGMTATLMLFFGQRVSKDYAGAAVLVPYFLMCAAGFHVLGTW